MDMHFTSRHGQSINSILWVANGCVAWLNAVKSAIWLVIGMMVLECSISIAPTLSQMQMDEKSLRLFFRVPKKLKLEHWPVKSDFTLCYSRMCDAPILQIGSWIGSPITASLSFLFCFDKSSGTLVCITSPLCEAIFHQLIHVLNIWSDVEVMLKMEPIQNQTAVVIHGYNLDWKSLLTVIFLSIMYSHNPWAPQTKCKYST